MSNLQRTLTIPAPAAAVWNTLKDFGGIHRWHPKVERSPLLSSNNEGLGAERVCHFHDGTSVREEIVEYIDGQRMRVSLSEFSMPLERADAILEVRAVSATSSEVTMTMDYDVKYGPLGWVMNNLMMQPMLGKLLGQILESLGEHVVSDGVSARAA